MGRRGAIFARLIYGMFRCTLSLTYGIIGRKTHRGYDTCRPVTEIHAIAMNAYHVNRACNGERVSSCVHSIIDIPPCIPIRCYDFRYIYSWCLWPCCFTLFYVAVSAIRLVRREQKDKLIRELSATL